MRHTRGVEMPSVTVAIASGLILMVVITLVAWLSAGASPTTSGRPQNVPVIQTAPQV
jgi:hypothetical protein